MASNFITVADFSMFNEVANALTLMDLQGVDDAKYPITAAWFDHISQLDCVHAGM